MDSVLGLELKNDGVNGQFLPPINLHGFHKK